MEITEQSSRKRQKLISDENTTEVDHPPVDRLSALPDDIIIRHILPLLPTKFSLRTSALAKRWRSMWARVPNLERLTTLPDNIICHILSFLPTTKHSVQTSIISKRWRHMWARVPVLHFVNIQYYEGTIGFSNIINSVLSRHELQHVDSFYMCLRRMHDAKCNNNDFDAWITTLVDRNIQKLHLYISCYFELKLPISLFTCKTLVDLSLDTGWRSRAILMPASTGVVYLPALKKLRLCWVDYESDESLPHLLSGCPVLEELSIIRNRLDKMICCYISSPTLKRLNMDNEFLYEACEVMLDTPALTYLQFDEWRPENIVKVGDLTSLIEADVACRSKRTPLVYFRSVLEFLCSKLHNVKSLRLVTEGMEVPNSAFSDLTTKFQNLTKLELDVDWRFITKFLEIADNLQELEITTCHPESNDVLKCWMEPKQVPACMVSHLRMVKILEFGCTKEEENMVRYFMRNAILLKKMVISRTYGIDMKMKSKVYERISLFEQGSELLCGCPVLEELSIDRNFDKMICCYISSPTMKRLDMDNECLNEMEEACEVKLDTPALTYLQFDEWRPENIVKAGDLTSLIEADVAYRSKRTPLVYFRSVF